MLHFANDKYQKIRLKALAWSEISALVFSAIVLCAYHMGYVHASNISVVYYSIIFWLVNAFIFYLIVSGRNRKFKDPSLTLFQMYWSTFNTCLAVAFISNFDSIFYLLLMLSMAFGTLKASKYGFIIFCLFQSLLLFLALLFKNFYFGETHPFQVILGWLVFSFCSIVLASLCVSIVKLRTKLKSHNNDLKEALKVKNEFLAVVSHEIRTPMNGVIGMLEIACEQENSSDKKQYLKTAYNSSQELLGIINNILDFTKLEKKQSQLNISQVNMSALLHDVYYVFKGIAANKGLKLTCSVDNHIPFFIHADIFKIKQIMNNLIHNAIKFTLKGEIIISAAGNKKNKCITISVSDTGIGVVPEKESHIFEPFTQADSSTTRLYGGTGLGLSIAHKLAMLMGDGISLKSNNGTGSIFTFNIYY